jgi:hypothetical protein
MTSMPAVDVILPQLAQPQLTQESRLEDGTAQASDGAMAAMAVLWASIFQQQILPTPEAPVADTAFRWDSSQAALNQQASGTLDADAATLPPAASKSATAAVLVAADILGASGLSSPSFTAIAVATGATATSTAIPLPEPTAKAGAQDLTATTIDAESPVGQVLSPKGITGLVAHAKAAPPLPQSEPAVATVEPKLADPKLADPVSPFHEVLPSPDSRQIEPSQAAPLEKAKPRLSRHESLTVLPMPMPEISSPAPIAKAGDAVTTTNVPASPEAASTAAPAEAAPVPMLKAPNLETVVQLRRKAPDRMLANWSSEAASSISSEVEASTPAADPQAQQIEDKTFSALPAPVQEAEQRKPELSMADKEPLAEASAQEVPQDLSRSSQGEDLPASKVSAEDAPVLAPLAESSKRDLATSPSTSPAPAPRPQASRPQESVFSQSFAAAPTKEARTISIRIPLNEGPQAGSSSARHIDLVFHQRSSDLTLQFQSPSGEIRQRIEEQMPSLLDKLRNEDWAAKSTDNMQTPIAMEQSAELASDLRRRPDSMFPASAGFESPREPLSTQSSNQHGSAFEDSPANRKDAQEQNQQGRNRKKEEAWQSEFEELLES